MKTNGLMVVRFPALLGNSKVVSVVEEESIILTIRASHPYSGRWTMVRRPNFLKCGSMLASSLSAIISKYDHKESMFNPHAALRFVFCNLFSAKTLEMSKDKRIMITYQNQSTNIVIFPL
jgi:hypothetical protein